MTETLRAGKRRHPYRRRRRHGRKRSLGPVFGAIDVGTNACRLLIAVPQVTHGYPVPRVIDSYTASVRLGEGLERAGSITDAALNRTIEALKVCSDRLRRRGVTHVRAVATEACRKATNAKDLIARAQSEAGIHLVVVSAEEEARLAAEGCVPLVGDGFEGALIFDIGGGSTELILVRIGAVGMPSYEIAGWASAPVGVVALAERHGARHLPASAYPAMLESIEAMFSDIRVNLGDGSFDAKRFHLLGTSGTLTTIAGVKLGLERYSRSRIDGQWLTHADVRALTETIAGKDFSGRAAIPCIGEDRADLILPGCAILSAIMRNWPSEHLRVADRGLREGLLMGLLRESKQAAEQ